MRINDPRAFDVGRREEEKAQRLRDFISSYAMEAGAAALSAGEPRDLLLVARSTDSPVLAATLSLRGELIAIGAAVHAIILSLGGDGDDLDTLRAKAQSPFELNVRIASHPRLIEAHEQLVLGDRSVWWGDSMRRDPLKRDAYESYVAGDRPAARLARLAFGRLWQIAQPLGLQLVPGDGAAMAAASGGQRGGEAQALTANSVHQPALNVD